MKGKRILQQDGAEPIRVAQHVEPGTDSLFIVQRGSGFVSETLPHFGGKQETRIGRHTLDPMRGEFGTQRIVEGSVDFDRVKKLGEIRCFVKTARTMRGIEDSVPIGIGPSGRSNQYAMRFWRLLIVGCHLAIKSIAESRAFRLQMMISEFLARFIEA